MNYAQACTIRDTLDSSMKAAAERLKALVPEGERLPSGLTPDRIKATPEWRAARADYDSAFARLRTFNQQFTRTFRREIRAERLERANSRQVVDA